MRDLLVRKRNVKGAERGAIPEKEELREPEKTTDAQKKLTKIQNVGDFVDQQKEG